MKWDANAAQKTLDAVVAKYDLSGKSYLIRFGTNAIYHLPDYRLVIRISRPELNLEIEKQRYECVKFLMGRGLQWIPRDEHFSESVVEGSYVTFWQHVPPSVTAINYEIFGKLLRQFHDLSLGYQGALPEMDAIKIVEDRLKYLAKHNIPSEEDFKFILERWTDVSKSYRKFKSKLGVGVIHGDADAGNTIQNAKANYLFDHDFLSIGAREWDLIPVLVAHRRFDVSDASYEAFCKGIGYDVREDKNLMRLVHYRELSSVTWLYRNQGLSDKLDAEIANRIRSLKDGDETAKWKKF